MKFSDIHPYEKESRFDVVTNSIKEFGCTVQLSSIRSTLSCAAVHGSRPRRSWGWKKRLRSLLPTRRRNRKLVKMLSWEGDGASTRPNELIYPCGVIHGDINFRTWPEDISPPQCHLS